jgi:hypothetical protein
MYSSRLVSSSHHQGRGGSLFDITPGVLLKEAAKAITKPPATQQVIEQRLQQPSVSGVERQTLESLGTPTGVNTWITRLQRQGDEAMRRSAGALLPPEERDEFFRISGEATTLFQQGRSTQNVKQQATPQSPEFQVGLKQLLSNTFQVIDKARRNRGAGKSEDSFLVRLAKEADKAARLGAAAQLPPEEGAQFLRLANTATQVFTLGRQKSILAAQLQSNKRQLEALDILPLPIERKQLQREALEASIKADEALLAGMPRLKRTQ